MKEYTGLLIVLYPAGGFAALTPVKYERQPQVSFTAFPGAKTMPIKASRRGREERS